MINITFLSTNPRGKDTTEHFLSRNCQLEASCCQTSCALTQRSSLNEYVNLLSLWKSPATVYKTRKEEML